MHRRSLYRAVAFLSLSVPVLLSCKNTTLFSTGNKLPDAASVLRIEYYTNAGYAMPDSLHKPTCLVSNPAVIRSILEEINTANAPAPWKGAGWDNVCIVEEDTTIVLHTNGTIIGTHGSGEFFQLPHRHFIERHFGTSN